MYIHSVWLVRDFDNTWLSCVLMAHRCSLVGHLSYVTTLLGLHAFGLLVHNDTLQALSRPGDMFSDVAMSLKPIFATWVQSLGLTTFDLETLDRRVVTTAQELGTADFLVHHIHAFSAHGTVLIFIKDSLYSRCSSSVSDKVVLGVRYPCDGPGRGGTCQISPWDHAYLGCSGCTMFSR